MTALAWAPGAGRGLYVSAGTRVYALDARAPSNNPCVMFEANEEVNGLAAGHAWVAVACDDGGVTLLTTGPTPPAHPPRARPLPRAHTNICSCVTPRPHRRDEVVSGGLDCTAARWNVDARRLVHRWDAGAAIRQGGGGLGEGPGAMAINPPFVNAVAATRSPARPVAAALAAACGDGSVLVMDGDAGQAPRRGRPARPDGPLAVLGRAQGGHTRAATCVAFVEGPSPGAPPPVLASGGDDGRLLLWSWMAAAAACAGPGGAQGPWRAARGRGEAGPALRCEVLHGHKVQAIAPGAAGALVVGDVEGEVRLYQVVG